MRRSRLTENISDTLKTIETFNPASIGTLILWYDWGKGSANDLSGSGRTGTLTHSKIVPYLNEKKMAVVTDSGYVSFTAVSTRTVIRCFISLGTFWVLSDSSNYNYHNAYPRLLNGTYAHASARNGAWRINGNSINPTATDITQYYSNTKKPIVISGVTTGSLSSNRIGFDRTYNTSAMCLLEDLVYSDPLSADNVKLIEKYLATKWQIYNYSFT